MINKLDEVNLDYQTKLNLSELFNNEEIKSLKESIPDLTSLIYLVSSNDFNSNNNSRLFNDNTNQSQYQYRYFPPSRKMKNNPNTSFLIDKEKFFPIILDTIKNFLEKEQKFLLSKSISLIIDEIMNISKIVKQNLIYNKFFKSIKNTKLISYSTNKDNGFKNIKVRPNTKDTKNKKIINRNSNTNTSVHTHTNTKSNINTKEYSKDIKNYQNETDININNNINIKKHLSFNNENEMPKKNDSKYYNNKSAFETKVKDKIMKGSSNRKDKSKTNSISKLNPSNIKMKNKKKDNKHINIFKRNMASMYNSSTQIKINKNNPSKISLKKSHYDNKKITDIFNNKNEFDLTIHQKTKKSSKDKVNKTHDKSNIKNNINKIITPSEIDTNLYKNIDTQEFNIFELESKIGREIILPLISYYIFNTFGFDEIFKYKNYENWCQKISDGYRRSNYYHNDLHAADITQTCLLYFKLGEFEEVHKFSKSNICSIFLSCICHDYQHPGVNNNFLKETNHKLSIRYNDISILENMHISAAFKLILSNKKCNIFDGINNDLYKQMRKEMISCVLATDMSFHNQYVDFLKVQVNDKKDEKIESKGNNQNNEENQKFMNLLIHSADISNPTKLFNIYFEWAKLVVEEFWDQGDKEKNLHLKCSCDREKVSIYQSQLGFINFIEIPYFSLFAELDPKLKFFYDNLLNNKNILLSMQEKEKEKKEKEKENKKSE